MEQWLNDNGLSLFIALFSSGGWLGFVVKLLLDNRKIKKDSIKELKKEVQCLNNKNKDLENEIIKFKSIEEKEKHIDKSKGSIYTEKLSNGNSRKICGFCWEKDHVTIPISTYLDYDEYTRQEYLSANCQMCGSRHSMDIENDFEEITEGDLPF